ncbi:PREDICTED: non-structural maintenance of chromosomes element 3 homolog [Eufriesea mexicana]|uniref:non-structural maintenance of chromosomes element 3 homolog n=1 Tax=Eufriesea mexicana TaxID=516756 RepID=UPI00083C61A4|nr:PREDICTED: non-structural maintenance of chromosomes element 3 homolog [Eufriesea mexicana]
MVLPRSHGKATVGKSLSQSSFKKRNNNVITHSQPLPSTSANISVSLINRSSQNSPPDSKSSEEDNRLVNSVIRYFLALDRGKQIVNKTRIIKHVLGNQGKHFLQIMNKAKNLLSKIFGYELVELEGNKYMLVNEIQNELPHIHPSAMEGNRQVLLFLVLTHIFMHEESCTKESLWDFLTNLGILSLDNHAYFGNIDHLITEVFVAQKYLDKITIEKSDSIEVEFKWGPRAEYEFSRRAALDFVSQVYNGRPINSWPLQFKSLIAREKSNQLQ